MPHEESFREVTGAIIVGEKSPVNYLVDSTSLPTGNDASSTRTRLINIQ